MCKFSLNIFGNVKIIVIYLVFLLYNVWIWFLFNLYYGRVVIIDFYKSENVFFIVKIIIIGYRNVNWSKEVCVM